MEELLHKLLAEQLQYYRLQRHDFLNHLQVLRGYLQLNMPGKALTYLTEGLESMEAEQQIGQISQPLVGAILLGLVVGLKKAGIGVEVALDTKVKGQDFWLKRNGEEYGEAFYGYTKECLEAAQKAARESGTGWSGDRCLKAALVLKGGMEDKNMVCSLALSENNRETGESTLLLEKKYLFSARCACSVPGDNPWSRN